MRDDDNPWFDDGRLADQPVTYLPLSESALELHALVTLRGTIGQRAQLQPLDAYRMPLGGPEYLMDQWQAALDRLGDLALAVSRGDTTEEWT